MGGLAGFITIFIMALVGLVLVLLVIGFFKLLKKIFGRRFVEWELLPTMDEYVLKHPGCKTGKGFKCHKCGSSSIKNWGMDSSVDKHRKFICNHCGTELYRNVL